MTAAAKANSKRIPQTSSLLEKIPISRSEARLVRAAKAVPPWQAVSPAKVIVVAAI